MVERLHSELFEEEPTDILITFIEPELAFFVSIGKYPLWGNNSLLDGSFPSDE
jgi:hypothetical protein